MVIAAIGWNHLANLPGRRLATTSPLPRRKPLRFIKRADPTNVLASITTAMIWTDPSLHTKMGKAPGVMRHEPKWSGCRTAFHGEPRGTFRGIERDHDPPGGLKAILAPSTIEANTIRTLELPIRTG